MNVLVDIRHLEHAQIHHEAHELERLGRREHDGTTRVDSLARLVSSVGRVQVNGHMRLADHRLVNHRERASLEIRLHVGRESHVVVKRAIRVYLDVERSLHFLDERNQVVETVMPPETAQLDGFLEALRQREFLAPHLACLRATRKRFVDLGLLQVREIVLERIEDEMANPVIANPKCVVPHASH